MKSFLKAFYWFFLGILFSQPASSTPINLVPNGDFELGNTQFGSDYTFSPTLNLTASQYTVRTNPFPWNPLFISARDHTSGSGNLFVGNGARLDRTVWFSSGITVTPNTNYFFEAWVMNVCCTPNFGQGNPSEPINPAVLSFYANGTLLGTRSTSSLGVWEGLSTTWNSGASTSVNLELRNANFVAQGNDFGVDDIFLGTESSVATPEPFTTVSVVLGGIVAGLYRWRKRI